MKKLLWTLVFAFILLLNAKAQEIITTAGDYSVNTNGSLSWTLGEPISETFSNGFNFLTQGFNQSQLSATATFELPGIDFQISAYPNPTSDFIILEVEQLRNLTYQIFSLKGELIFQDKIKNKQTNINFKPLIPASYIVKIIENNIPVKQFKIVKR